MADITLDPIQGLIVRHAVESGINPALALSLADQESGLNPQAKNPNGDQYGAGLFGFIPSTAKDRGMTSEQRFDADVSAQHGTRYLRELLDSHNGDVRKALRAYGGADAPQGDAQYDDHVLNHYGKYAHLAGLRTAQDVQQGQKTDPYAVSDDELLKLSKVPAESQKPAPYGVSDDDLRSLTQGFDHVQKNKPTQQQNDALPEAIKDKLSPLNVDLSRPSGLPFASTSEGLSAQTTSPGFTLISKKTEDPATSFEGNILGDQLHSTQLPEAKGDPPAFPLVLNDPQALRDALVAESQHPSIADVWRNTKASTIQTLGGIVGGAAGSAVGLPTTGVALGSLAGNQASKYLGYTDRGTPMITIPETKYTPAIPLDRGDIFTAGLPFAMQGISAAGRSIVQHSQAGKALTVAEQELSTAKAQWEKTQQQNVGRTMEENAAAQQAYEGKRAGIVESGSESYAAQQAKLAESQSKYDAAQQAVAQHGKIAQTLGKLADKYGPDIPSRELYQTVRDMAPNAPVDTAPLSGMAKTLRADLGVPESPMQAGSIDRLLGMAEKAPKTLDIHTTNEQMKDVGRYLQNPDPRVRYAARKIYGGYQDALEQSAAQSPATKEAVGVLKDAKASWRKEQVQSDLADKLKLGGGIVKLDDQGRPVVNVARLMNEAEKLSQDEFVQGSLSPAELKAMKDDLQQFKGTSRMPRTMPQAPELAPGSVPNTTGAKLGQLPAPTPTMPRPAEPVPSMSPVTTPRPPPASLTFRDLAAAGAASLYGPNVGSFMGIPGQAIPAVAAAATAHYAPYAFARMLLSPIGRKMILEPTMHGEAIIPPRAMQVMQAIGSTAGRKGAEALEETP